MERRTVAEWKKIWKFYIYENCNPGTKQWEEAIILTEYKGTEKEVVVPNKIGRRPVRAIEELGFSGNKSITSVTIPENVIALGENIFDGCEALKTVEISSKKILLRENCFSNCPVLEEVKVDLESAILGNHMFQNCWKLLDQNGFVIIDRNNSKILIDVQLPVLSETVIIPKGVTHILGGALSENDFYEYSNVERIKKVILPESVIEIGDYSFADCRNLESINIPKGIKRIGELAFVDCEALQGISIMNDNCSIGACAFAGCDKIDDERLIRSNSIPPIGRRDLLWIY